MAERTPQTDLQRIAQRFSAVVRSVTPMHGGCVARVLLVEFEQAPPLWPSEVVVKHDARGSGTLLSEACMLRFLQEHAPVPAPRVLDVDQHWLAMTRLRGTPGPTARDWQDLGRVVARLHSIAGVGYGFERDTVIGPLRQPNPWSPRWVPFFAQHRLVHMARTALDAGRIGSDLGTRLERLADTLADRIDEPSAPALLHGDLWSGNILCENGTISGLIDPALSFGHSECDLAMLCLFDHPDHAFWRSYRQVHSTAKGLEERIRVYQLWPLLVHCVLFAGPYPGMLEQQLDVLGA